MKIGLRLPQTGKDHATKENMVHLAKETENAGLDSLWVLERLVWPINPQNPYPGTRDGRFPDDWQYIFDPIETLRCCSKYKENCIRNLCHRHAISQSCDIGKKICNT